MKLDIPGPKIREFLLDLLRFGIRLPKQTLRIFGFVVLLGSKGQETKATCGRQHGKDFFAFCAGVLVSFRGRSEAGILGSAVRSRGSEFASARACEGVGQHVVVCSGGQRGWMDGAHRLTAQLHVSIIAG